MNSVGGYGCQYSVVLHGMNMKFCPLIVIVVDCTWWTFNVDIVRFDIARDVFRWRNLRDDLQPITHTVYRWNQTHDTILQITNYVIVQRHVRRQIQRYQCEISHTYSQPSWQCIAKLSCSFHVRRLSTDFRNLPYRFGVGTLRFLRYVESDPTGV